MAPIMRWKLLPDPEAYDMIFITRSTEKFIHWLRRNLVALPGYLIRFTNY